MVRVENWISTTLRIGVGVCSIALLIGLILGVSSSSEFGITQELFRGEELSAPAILSFSEVLHGLLSGKGQAWVFLGIFLLILLPIIRVGMTLFIYLFEKDYLFVGITGFVLTVLLFGLIFGKAL